MKRLLPNLLLFLAIFGILSSFVATQIFAVDLAGTWVVDNEVTFVGKTAARAGAFLDWTLENYKWVQLGNEGNPLIPFWIIIRNLVYAFFALFILSTAFLMMITRGSNISLQKFIPRFVGILLLVTFSFGMVQIIYQLTDITQGFFLRNPDPATAAQRQTISQENLLNIAFKYEDFVGYKRVDSLTDESAFMTLLLTRLTAVTYYAMAAMLIIRKIVLWFFIIISPIFPLLLFYWPIRNTAKIWIGEFFRWVLYGPLFAVLLAGLVSLWQSTIPLFSYQPTGTIVTKTATPVYQTAVNILLGGPRQTIGLASSVNLPETFALYTICLMMLWAVMILPFILLRIFLDYLFSLALNDAPGMKQFIALSNTMLNRQPLSPVPPPSPPSFPTGKALSLPFGRKLQLPFSEPITQSVTPASQAKSLPQARSLRQTVSTQQQQQQATPVIRSTEVSRLNEVLKQIQVAIPTMRDIARYDTSQIKTITATQTSTPVSVQNLQQISNPQLAKTPVERQQFERIRETLRNESQRGNQFANVVLQASSATVSTPVTVSDDRPVLINILNNIATPERVTQITEKTVYEKVKETVGQQAMAGNSFATTLNQYISSKTDQASSTQSVSTEQALTTIINQLAHPEVITNTSDKQNIETLKETITKEAVLGTPLARQLLSLITQTQSLSPSVVTSLTQQMSQSNTTDQSVVNYITNTYMQQDTTEITESHVATFIQHLAQPDLLPQKEKETVMTIRETIVKDAQKGDQLATQLLPIIQSPQNITQDLIKQVTQTIREVRGSVNLQSVLARLVQKQTAPVQTTTAPVQPQKVTEIVEKLLQPELITDQKEKESYTTLLTFIKQEQVKGNKLAIQLLDMIEGRIQASKEIVFNLTQQIRLEAQQQTPFATKLIQTVTPVQPVVTVEKVKDELVKAKDRGDQLAGFIYSLLVKQRQQKPTTSLIKKDISFPVVNRVQNVSLEDYEAVKKIWKENYENLDEPIRQGQKVPKAQFISQDIAEITEAINLLSSPVNEKRQEGLKKVSGILPFLLIGGFSQTEIVGYLKAKQEAAKDVLEDVDKKEQEEESKLPARREEKKPEMKMQHMEIKEEIPTDKTEKKTPISEERT